MASLSETFGLRDRWFKMLFKVLPEKPALFDKANIEDAQYDLGGIGPRQVPAIQEWALGMSVIYKKDNLYYLTELGELFRKYDLTLSEFGTAWAMHYSLCINSQDLKSKLWFYYHYSNTFAAGIFRRDDVKSALASATSSESVLDKKIVGPLCETMREWSFAKSLGIGDFSDPKDFSRRAPSNDQLHPAIMAYMLYDWAHRNARPGVNIAEFFNYGGVARLLAMEEQQFCEYLQLIHDRYHKKVLWVSFTAGLNSVTFEKNIKPLALLEMYYLEFLSGMEPLDAFKTATETTV
ncbi:MAG: DUF4007 family protein [Chlorobium sp.]|nr:DUF4007 family protein [Chlorobium sp.]